MSAEDDFSGRLVIVGLGLIGGSVGQGAREHGLCREVVGVVRDSATADIALARGVVDRACLDIADVAGELGEGDIVFIAVPTLAVASVLERIRPLVSDQVTITDGASVKGSVVAAAQSVYGECPAQFVPGHPIAGSERSGVTAANPHLYENHRVILTPLAQTGAKHLARVRRLWECLGAQVLNMSVAEHDQVLGATSHLPHAIAYSLVDTLAHDLDNPNIFRYAAGGFRDFTRIASSDPVMWHDIMQANREAVVASLDLFMDNLTRLKKAVAEGDSDYLLDTFTRAKQARDKYIQYSVKPSRERS